MALFRTQAPRMASSRFVQNFSTTTTLDDLLQDFGGRSWQIPAIGNTTNSRDPRGPRAPSHTFAPGKRQNSDIPSGCCSVQRFPPSVNMKLAAHHKGKSMNKKNGSYIYIYERRLLFAYMESSIRTYPGLSKTLYLACKTR